MKSSFGERLFFSISEKGISVAEVAEQLGVSRQTIYKWKNNGGITDEKVQKLAQILNISPGWLRFGKNSYNQEAEETTWGKSRNELVNQVIKSEQRLRLALNAAQMATWEYSILTNQFNLSDEFSKYFGTSSQNLKCSSNTFFEAVHLDDRKKFEATIEALLKTAHENNGEIRLYGENNTIVWASFWAIRLEDSSNRTIGIIGAFQNITKNKLTELELRKSKLSLVEAQRIAHMGVWEWRIPEDEIFWSDEVYRIFKISQNKFQPSLDGYLKCIHPSDRKKVEDTIQQALIEQGSYYIEHRLLHADGSIAYIEGYGNVYANDDGTLQRILGTVLDITQRKMIGEVESLKD